MSCNNSCKTNTGNVSAPCNFKIIPSACPNACPKREIQVSIQDNNQYILNILQKLQMAKQNLSPVIEEIISCASTMSIMDYKQLCTKNSPLCTVTAAQFAGAIQASKLLYEVNEHLNQVDKGKPCKCNQLFNADITVNTLTYPDNRIDSRNVSNCDRIFIDKELMQQLIELHELLGDTIQRLRMKQEQTDCYGEPSECTMVTSQSKRQMYPDNYSKSSLQSRCSKSAEKDSGGKEGTFSYDHQEHYLSYNLTPTNNPVTCPNPQKCPVLSQMDPKMLSFSQESTYTKAESRKKSCCPKKGPSESEIKKRKKREKKLRKLQKKQEKQAKKAQKKREKEARKSQCPRKKRNLSSCCKCAPKKSENTLYYGRVPIGPGVCEASSYRHQLEITKTVEKPSMSNKLSVTQNKSKSTTIIQNGNAGNINSLDEAKKCILDCLAELSEVRKFLKRTQQKELDMENQIVVTGDMKSRECCERENKSHVHATLNGIPIVLQLNEESIKTLLANSHAPPAAKNDLGDVPSGVLKCRCGPVELQECTPSKTNLPPKRREDLDYEPTIETTDKETDIKRSTVVVKTQSLPTVTSKDVIISSESIHSNKTSKSISPAGPPSNKSSKMFTPTPAIIKKHSEDISGMPGIRTPETSVTVFSTKKTKDGQKLRLTLTISPMDKDMKIEAVPSDYPFTPEGSAKIRDYKKAGFSSSPYQTDIGVPFRSRDVIPERDYSTKSRRDGFETDESDPGVPYTADQSSLPDFTYKEGMVKTTLTTSGIYHPNINIQKELQDLGLENLIRACRPAKCCRKSVINEKPRNALPYPASLMSLPLDEADLDMIKEIIRQDESNENLTKTKYQTFHFKFDRYTNFQRDDKFPWKIPKYEVRFFEIFKTEKVGRHAETSNRTRHGNIQPHRTRNEKPFFSWLPSCDFNTRFFDVLRKKDTRNACSQTISDSQKNNFHNDHKSSVQSKSNKAGSCSKGTSSFMKEIQQNNPKSGKLSSVSKVPVPFSNIIRRTKPGVKQAQNVLKTADCNSCICSSFDDGFFSTDEIQQGMRGIKENCKKKMCARNCNFMEGFKLEKDMIKLVPLQPYLIESVTDKINNNRQSRHISFKNENSSIYHPPTNSTNHSSRIIYKKCEPGNLIYLSPQNNKRDKKIKGDSGDSKSFNDHIFPRPPCIVSTYYNTIVRDDESKNEKSKPNSAQKSKCMQNISEGYKQCCCSNASALHDPESLENMYVDGVIPCYCSKCSLASNKSSIESVKGKETKITKSSFNMKLLKQRATRPHSFDNTANSNSEKSKNLSNNKTNSFHKVVDIRNNLKNVENKMKDNTTLTNQEKKKILDNKETNTNKYLRSRSVDSARSTSSIHKCSESDFPKKNIHPRSKSVGAEESRLNKKSQTSIRKYADDETDVMSNKSTHSKTTDISNENIFSAKKSENTSTNSSFKQMNIESSSSNFTTEKHSIFSNRLFDEKLGKSSKFSKTSSLSVPIKNSDIPDRMASSLLKRNRNSDIDVESRETMYVTYPHKIAEKVMSKKSRISFENSAHSVKTEPYDEKRKKVAPKESDSAKKQRTENAESKTFLSDIPETNIPTVFSAVPHYTHPIILKSSLSKVASVVKHECPKNTPTETENCERIKKEQIPKFYGGSFFKLHMNNRYGAPKKEEKVITYPKSSLSFDNNYYTRIPSFYSPIKPTFNRNITNKSPVSKTLNRLETTTPARTPASTPAAGSKTVEKISKIKEQTNLQLPVEIKRSFSPSFIDKGIKDSISDFSKVLSTISTENCAKTFPPHIITTRLSGINEKSIKHSFSAYNAHIDGKKRPGYISVLQPTCGCPEITVFIPCYCDDTTILGETVKPSKIPIQIKSCSPTSSIRRCKNTAGCSGRKN